MKRFIAVFLLLPFTLMAQSVKFNIQGTVKNTKGAKFAYLTTLSQQIPIASDKIFIVTPIINGKFEFKGTFDLEGRDLQHACVFVDERANISKEEVASKFRQLVWVTDRDNNLKHIFLENLKLDVQEYDQMKNATVVEGGTLTKELAGWNAAMRQGDKNLVEFVRKNPDSRVSFEGVESVTRPVNPSKKDFLESRWGSPKELYALLSERLKKSKKGIALKKKVDAY